VLPEPETAKRIVQESIISSAVIPGAVDNNSDCDKSSSTTNDESPTNHVEDDLELAMNGDLATKQIIAVAAQQVGSLNLSEFDIRFNPDCYCDTVVHAPGEDIDRQRQLVAEAAQFLLVTQIPAFVRDCLEHSLTPIDGSGLSDAMHSRGINMRYLGKIVQCLADISQLDYFRVSHIY
jgi:protein TIF31